MVSRNDGYFLGQLRGGGDDEDGHRPGPGDADALIEQVLRYLGGHSSDEAVTMLGDRLRADAAARDLFVRVCLLDSLLSERFAPGRREFMSDFVLDEGRGDDPHGASSFDAVAMRAISDEEVDDEPEPLEVPAWPAPPPVVPPWWRWRSTWVGAAIAATVLLTVGVWALVSASSRTPLAPTVAVQPRPEQPSPAESVPPPPPPPLVATLSGVNDVKWGGASVPPSVGESLPAQSELVLSSGLARLTFRSGANVVVEGPARFTPDAFGRMTLASGRLTALVPSAAKGFTVRTPTAEIVDLGTEFGVDVPDARGASVQVMVFEGLVTLSPPVKANAVSAASQPAQHVLPAGTGAKVDPTGAVTPVPVNPVMFVRHAEADALERAKSGSAFGRWAAYRYELARNPDVVAYYPFDAENKARSPDRLANASGAGPALDGTLAGDDGTRPQWVAGRWPEKAALAFGEAGVPRVTFPGADAAMDFSRGPVPGEGQAFTVAAWFKAKSKATPGVGLVGRGVRGEEQFALETESTFYRFVLRDGVLADRRSVLNSRNYVSAYWHHVAATYEPATTTMRLYVDGAAVNDQAAGAGVAPKMLRPAEGPVVLGCRVMSPGVFGMPLDGTVDELVFIRRAITPGEVRQMYEAGKPN